MQDAAKIEFVEIPAGTFMMGSPKNERDRAPDEGPKHRVHVPAFVMSKYPITVEQYDPAQPGNRLPQTGISWHEAKAFAEKIGCRLPTESEWEYACRAGTRTRFYSGDKDKDMDRAGWYSENSCNHPHPVGEKKPNAFGLYDMHGNVWEWCEDYWHENYKGTPIDGSAWTDNPGCRVMRGGSWVDSPRHCRSASRFCNHPYLCYVNVGFRVVVSSSSPRTS